MNQQQQQQQLPVVQANTLSSEHADHHHEEVVVNSNSNKELLRSMAVWVHSISCFLVLAGVFYFLLPLMNQQGAIVPELPVACEPLLYSGFSVMGLGGTLRLAHQLQLLRNNSMDEHSYWSASPSSSSNESKQFGITAAGLLLHIFFTLAAVLFAIGFLLAGSFFGYVSHTNVSKAGDPFFCMSCAFWSLTAVCAWFVCNANNAIAHTIVAALFLETTIATMNVRATCCKEKNDGYVDNDAIQVQMFVFIVALVFLSAVGILYFQRAAVRSCCNGTAGASDLRDASPVHEQAQANNAREGLEVNHHELAATRVAV